MNTIHKEINENIQDCTRHFFGCTSADRMQPECSTWIKEKSDKDVLCSFHGSRKDRYQRSGNR